MRASLSYIPGAHSMKFGYQGSFSHPSQATQPHAVHPVPVQQRRPQSVEPDGRLSRRRSSSQRNLLPTSFYVQDTWTRNRLTLQGGVRYDAS